jgi:hypothetical protein
MAKKAKTVKVDGLVFDEALMLLEGRGYPVDRDAALGEIALADGEIEDWQTKLNYMDSEALADWLESWMVDEINRDFTDAEMADYAE